MELIKKVVSPETAVKLAEAGFPQNTERYWVWEEHKETPYLSSAKSGVYESFAAPDVQEIGELLPTLVSWDGVRYIIEISEGAGWYVRYKSILMDGRLRTLGNMPYFHSDVDDKAVVSMSEAFAAAWLWLKSQGLC